MKSIERIARKAEHILPEKVINNIRPLFYNVESFLMKIGLISLDDLYDKKFFMDHLEDAWLKENELITELIYDKFKPKSVVDFGCGSGTYLYFFSKRGVNKLKGFEGSQNAIELALIDEKYIDKCDITKKVELNETYDLCICFEVAEHLPESCVDAFLDNLCSSSATILFTAAPPGQGGRHHVNLKPVQYWIHKFDERHYCYQKSLTDEIKKELDVTISGLAWMKTNIMIFQKKLEL
jgi:SAM-dependent methyltransferase